MAFDLMREKEADFVLDPEHVRESLGADGLVRDDGHLLIQAYEGLGPLVSGPRCRLDVLCSVDGLTRSSIWLVAEYGAPTGALLIVPLSATGAIAAANDTFNALDPAIAHICRPGEPIRAFYGWLFAGVTDTARRRVLKGAKKVCEGEFGFVPVYARAASPKGAATLTKLGFEVLENSNDQYVKHPGNVS